MNELSGKCAANAAAAPRVYILQGGGEINIQIQSM